MHHKEFDPKTLACGTIVEGELNMKVRLGILGMTLTSLAALGAANAADIYRGPAGAPGYGPSYAVVNWSGFYAGVNGGGG